MNALAHDLEVTARLDMLDEGQTRIEQQLSKIVLMLHDAINEALLIKQENVALTAEIGRLKARVELIELGEDNQ